MAEAAQDDAAIIRSLRREIVKRMFRSIENNLFHEIKEIFENLEPRSIIKILNSTMHRCLPLYIAINLNNIKISRYLLKYSLLQGFHEMSKRWKKYGHPLVAAIDVGNPVLIELILQHIPNINESISGPLSPLMVAIFLGNLNSLKVIVAKGADVNRPCLHGRIPLMYSTSNSKVCSFLLSQGANVNHQDDEGFTALHLALGWNNREAVNLLIGTGADVKIETFEGITPLIWLTMNQHLELFVDFGKSFQFSELDRIEALEILNALYAGDQKTDIITWAGALDARMRHDFPKNSLVPIRELLEYSEEFATETELKFFQGNPLYLAYQSILVTERILGRNNRLYMQFLLQTAIIAKNQNHIEKVRQFVDHCLEYCHETDFVTANVLHFTGLFYEICKDEDPDVFRECGGFPLFRMIGQTALKMWSNLKEDIRTHPSFVDNYYSEVVDTFLYLTSIINCLSLSAEDFCEFRLEVRKVLKEDLRLAHQQSLLHRAIALTEKVEWASLELIKALLESGADAMSQDVFEQTPFTYALKHVPENVNVAVLDLIEAHVCDLVFKQ